MVPSKIQDLVVVVSVNLILASHHSSVKEITKIPRQVLGNKAVHLASEIRIKIIRTLGILVSHKIQVDFSLLKTRLLHLEALVQ